MMHDNTWGMNLGMGYGFWIAAIFSIAAIVFIFRKRRRNN